MANYDLTYEGSRVQSILDTGDELRDAGYIFRGEATPSTVPGTPTERVAYIGGPGTYTNFGSSISVGAGCICIFKYTGSAWSNQVINTGLDSAVNTLQSAITAINNNIGNGYVYAGVATPSTSPVTGKVFYLAVQAGTYTNFGNAVVTAGLNVIKYNGSAWSVDQVIAIDAEPTQGSANLVKSGGVLNSIIQNGPAFDLSAYNAQGGVLATYADLSAALTALNALPADFKKGGMSMKFVLSSDNKYVQFRCMAQNFTTAVADWQGVDDEPIDGSTNLIESGGVYTAIKKFIEENDNDQEYKYVLIDTNKKIAFCINDTDKAIMYLPTEFTHDIKVENLSVLDNLVQTDERNKLLLISLVENEEFKEVKLDSKNKIYSCIGRDGIKREYLRHIFTKGIESPEIEQINSQIETINDTLENLPTPPTKVSQLSNDENFVKSSQVYKINGQSILEGDIIIGEGGQTIIYYEDLGSHSDAAMSQYGVTEQFFKRDADDVSIKEAAADNLRAEYGDIYIKAVLLDCGRKYISPSNIKALLDAMYSVGMTHMYLHFSENQGLRFMLNNMIVTANGTNYNLEPCVTDDTVGDLTGKYITQSDMDGIITYANSKNIEIVPSFDMPGHMQQILKFFPQFKWGNRNKEIDVTSPEATNFALAVLEKYASYFAKNGCKYFDIAADEFNDDNYAALSDEVYNKYVEFVNRAIGKVLEFGMIPSVFNGGVCARGDYTNAISKAANINYWTYHSDFATDEKLLSMGYRIINSSSQMYYILGDDERTAQLYQRFQNFNTRWCSNLIDYVYGCMFCIWCDNPTYHGDDNGSTLVSEVTPLIGLYGDNLNRNGKTHFLTTTTSANVSVQQGGISYIDFTVPQNVFISSITGISIEDYQNVMMVGFTNLNCKTTNDGHIYDGTARLWITTTVQNVTIPSGKSITINY